VKNILIIITESYGNYGRALIASLLKHQADVNIYLYLINASKEFIDEITLQVGNMPVVVRERNDWSLSTDPVKWAGKSEVICYSANIRGEVIRELLTVDKLDNLVYIDADSVLIDNIDGAFDLQDKCHIMFHFRPKERDIGNILSGIIFLNNRPVTLEFLDEYCKRIREENILNWYSDQKALNKTYEYFKLREDIVFFNLSKKYIDWNYSAESKIWAGKGRSKKRKEFRKIQKTYLREFFDRQST